LALENRQIINLEFGFELFVKVVLEFSLFCCFEESGKSCRDSRDRNQFLLFALKLVIAES